MGKHLLKDIVEAQKKEFLQESILTALQTNSATVKTVIRFANCSQNILNFIIKES